MRVSQRVPLHENGTDSSPLVRKTFHCRSNAPQEVQSGVSSGTALRRHHRREKVARSPRLGSNDGNLGQVDGVGSEATSSEGILQLVDGSNQSLHGGLELRGGKEDCWRRLLETCKADSRAEGKRGAVQARFAASLTNASVDVRKREERRAKDEGEGQRAVRARRTVSTARRELVNRL